jgi:hypothetical protein
MVMQCQLNHAEMREAFRMNLTLTFWLRAILSNLRALVILGVFFAAVVAKVMKGEDTNWESLLVLLPVAAALIAFYLWRLSSRLQKAAAQVNAACRTLTLDTQGITTASATGVTTFTPWAECKKWKEGKLVFTIGDARQYRTVPKSAVSEMQAQEIRMLLQASIPMR